MSTAQASQPRVIGGTWANHASIPTGIRFVAVADSEQQVGLMTDVVDDVSGWLMSVKHRENTCLQPGKSFI